jgi:spore coat polysaccharide biosynthesis protein SpsF
VRVVCIIQARLRSTRLPAKVLLPLPTGRTVLQEVVDRCMAIPGVDDVVVAMPGTEECRKLLAPFVDSAQWHFGSELDVLARYYSAAKAFRADVIVRVTADCPMIDPIICGQVIRHRAQHSQYYSYNNMPAYPAQLGTFPQGLDCEVFTFEALECEYESNGNSKAREHVTYGLRQMAMGTDQPMNPAGDHSHLRWTLDDIDDYVRICGLMSINDFEADLKVRQYIRAFRG